MTRAVLDTNVYVSALVFGGKPARVLQLAAAGAFQLIVSETIRAELLETLATRFAWPADRAAEVRAQLWDAAHWVVHPRQVRAARDQARTSS
jgi:predicted nucleic acid-binding protein